MEQVATAIPGLEIRSPSELAGQLRERHLRLRSVGAGPRLLSSIEPIGWSFRITFGARMQLASKGTGELQRGDGVHLKLAPPDCPRIGGAPGWCASRCRLHGSAHRSGSPSSAPPGRLSLRRKVSSAPLQRTTPGSQFRRLAGGRPPQPAHRGPAADGNYQPICRVGPVIR